MKPWKLLVAMACIAGSSLNPALAAYPDKPIRLIVPYPAGGGSDAVARVVAKKLSDLWGQSVVIDNRAGADTQIGNAAVATAAPDGYTLLLIATTFKIHKHFVASLPYDPEKDFTPIAPFAVYPYWLVVGNEVPVKTVADLLALAKKNPGKLNHAVSSGGQYVLADLMKKGAGIDVLAVRYKGGTPAVQATVDEYRALLESARPGLPWPEPQFQLPAVPEARSISSTGTPFAYSHSPSLAELLEKARSTLAITTYKTGHLLLARSEGGKINAEVKGIQRAMGVAATRNRLAVGAADTILTYSANTAIAPAVTGPHPVDTAYVPRSVVHTGDILVHEMAYGSDNLLYFVNTRFSCLCRLDLDHSFVPVWRPPWVTALAAEDRCHLNGLALVDGGPRYVTALARTDTRHGWRELKGTAGVVVEVPDGRIVAEGLAMPHSPRWHRNRLWVLESGRGTLATVDPASGRVETVATLPGFTRGLAFVGRYALVGLSQVRETVFSELPITQGASERWCGVAVVDIDTGAVVGALRFSAAVQEIFDVAVLPFAWPTLLEASPLTANTFVVPDRDLAEMVTGG